MLAEFFVVLGNPADGVRLEGVLAHADACQVASIRGEDVGAVNVLKFERGTERLLHRIGAIIFQGIAQRNANGVGNRLNFVLKPIPGAIFQHP